MIWSLFRRHYNTHKPPHILCHGYLRAGTANPHHSDAPDPTTIPGILSQVPNEYVHQLKAEPWTRLSALLGKHGGQTLIDMFLECGIFLPLESGNGNLLQICGLSSRRSPLAERAYLTKPPQENPYRISSLIQNCSHQFPATLQ